MLQRVADLYTAEELKDWSDQSSRDGKTWVMARPLGFQGLCLRRRIALAWGVFTGRYDALCWHE
jgi:hypothetical protein